MTDQKLIQRIFNTYTDGRQVNTCHVLKHDLLYEPKALVKIDGAMNFTNKSDTFSV